MNKIWFAIEKIPYFLVRIFAISIFSAAITVWLWFYSYDFWITVLIILIWIAIILLFTFGLYKFYKEYKEQQLTASKKNKLENNPYNNDVLVCDN